MDIKILHQLKEPELTRLVSLHDQVLTESFLNNFGLEFLGLIYQNLAQAPDIILLVAYDNGQIAGYALATTDYSRFITTAFSQRRVKLFCLMIKNLLRKPGAALKLLWSLPAILLTKKEPHPELQFIALDPASQGQGFGHQLMAALKSEFLKRGIHQYYVGTKADNLLSNRFYQKLGFSPVAPKTYFGDRLNCYLSPKF